MQARTSWPVIQWIDPQSESIYSIERDSILRIWRADAWEIQDTLQFLNLRESDFLGVEALQLVPSSDGVLFTAPGTQQVYSYSPLNHQFSRVDSSINRGNNFQAIQWVSGDTLYSLGGVGFWESHSVLSSFNRNTGSWEVVSTVGGPSSVTNDLYQWDDSRKCLYVSYCLEIQGEIEARSTEVWKFHLPSRKWEMLGHLHPEVVELLKGKELRVLLPSGLYLDGDKRVLIDLVENRYDYIDASICDARLSSQSLKFEGEGHFISENALVNYYIPANSSDGKSVGNRYPLTDFRNARLQPKDVFESGWPTWHWIGLGLVSVLVFWLAFKVFQKLQEPFRKGSTQTAEERFFQTLEPLEVKLLRALLRSEMRSEGLKSGPITEIMGWTDKSWDNQRKWRNNTIKELNKRAMDHLNIEELIRRERDPNDKRERVYRLDPNGFRLLRDSLHFTQ